jgi:hypothetical protein
VCYSVPSFLLVPELLQIDDLIALVPSRLLRGHGERLTLLRSPVNVRGFDVIAVWHPRVDKRCRASLVTYAPVADSERFQATNGPRDRAQVRPPLNRRDKDSSSAMFRSC